MLKVIGGVPDGEYKAIASGTLPSGKPVVVNADGTVSVVGPDSNAAPTIGSETVFNTASYTNFIEGVYDANANKVVIAYSGGSAYGNAIVGTISGSTITFGTPVVFESATTEYVDIDYDSTNNKVLIVYQDQGNTSRGTAIVGTVSGTSISFGTPAVFTGSSVAYYCRVAYDSNAGKFLIIYEDGNILRGRSCVATISGTSVSFGSVVDFNDSNDAQPFDVKYDTNAQKLLIIYQDISNSNRGTARVGTISGTSVSYGSENVFEDGNTNDGALAYNSDNQNFALIFRDGADSSKLKACVATISSTSVQVGSVTNITSVASSFPGASYNTLVDKVIVTYENNSDGLLKSREATMTGTGTSATISFGDEHDIGTKDTIYATNFIDTSTNTVIVAYRRKLPDPDTGDCFTYIANNSNLTAENYIGMSQGYTDRGSQSVGSESVFESASVIDLSAAYDANAQKVVVAYTDNGNSRYGTAVVGTVSGTSITFGTPVVFASRNIENATPVYDSNAQKIVIGYEDRVNTYGTGIVGTVSGNSISFGSAQIFDAVGITQLSGAFDSNNNKVVFAFNTSSFNGKAVVGTVSGTSISFGSFYTFESGTTSYTSTVYDTNAQKIVISYVDGEDSFNGKSVVATVSGTAISYGSLTTFNNASTAFVGSVYDPDSQKVIVTYQDNGNSSYGTAIVGTVSGTSISFGSEIVFNAASTQYTSATYDEGQNKLVVAYRDVGNSNSGTVIPGTVSGSSITFGDETVFNGSESNFVTAVYDAASGNSVISYIDNGNSNYGTSVVFQNAYDNSGSVADGDNARVDIIGSVSDNQSGLTAGEKYYVQTDGTLSTTAGSPSVLAGTAISATKLVVKT